MNKHGVIKMMDKNSDSYIKYQNTINYILEVLLKWSRSGYIDPIITSEKKLASEIQSWLAAQDYALAALPLSDPEKMMHINKYLSENFIIVVTFNDKQPIYANLERKNLENDLNSDGKVIVDYILPKAKLREAIKEALLDDFYLWR